MSEEFSPDELRAHIAIQHRDFVEAKQGDALGVAVHIESPTSLVEEANDAMSPSEAVAWALQRCEWVVLRNSEASAFETGCFWVGAGEPEPNDNLRQLTSQELNQLDRFRY